MNVQRLASSTRDDFERSLLRSARGEGPSAESIRTAAAVLTGGAVITATGTAAAAGGASLAGKAAASSVLTKGVLALIAPWIAAGVVTSGVVIGVATVVSRPFVVETRAPAVSATQALRQRAAVVPNAQGAVSRPATESSAPSEAIAPSAAAVVQIGSQRSTSASATASSEPTAAEQSRTAPSAATQTEPAPSAPVPSAPVVEPRSSVTEEVRVMDRAREAMASGRALEALVLLDQYSRDFPRGTLSLEAEVLKIEACAASGRRDRAIFLAERFLASHPNDAHAPRVRSVLAALSNR